jgi:hypothetical protein
MKNIPIYNVLMKKANSDLKVALKVSNCIDVQCLQGIGHLKF